MTHDQEMIQINQEPDYRTRLERKVDRILLSIHGNGQKGLKSRVEATETSIKMFWTMVGGCILAVAGTFLNHLLRG